MSSKKDDSMRISILSPETGRAVPLDQVPDPVFSQKIIGDGIAIIPSDGRITSPVDGEVASVAETLHAWRENRSIPSLLSWCAAAWKERPWNTGRGMWKGERPLSSQ